MYKIFFYLDARKVCVSLKNYPVNVQPFRTVSKKVIESSANENSSKSEKKANLLFAGLTNNDDDDQYYFFILKVNALMTNLALAQMTR